MTAVLLQLWPATAYPFAVVLLIRLWNARGRRAYVGRHRNGRRRPPAEHWAAAYETRIGAELGRYLHSGGAGRYAHLRPAELDAKAERDQALADMGLLLRSPFSTPEVADIWDLEEAAA